MLVRDCETHITNIYTSCCIYSQFKVSIVRGSVQPSNFRCVHHAGPRTTDWIVSIGLQTLRAISCAVGADRMLGKKTKPQLVVTVMNIIIIITTIITITLTSTMNLASFS
jgi:hypothetical protein